MLIGTIILIPLVLSAAAPAVRSARALGLLNAGGYGLLLAATVLLTADFLAAPSPRTMWGCCYLDHLSVFFMLTTAVVAFAAAVYSIGYLETEARETGLPPRKVGAYYVFFNLFCLVMLLATVLSNLALVWITIELTTLVSAFLVGFHNVKESIEAAWKYIIICSVGITLALLGIILFYYTSSADAGVRSLEWSAMLSGAARLDPRTVRTALVLIFVGYGAKAGFAPLHNWLPDAHSQALSPASGLLSGVLLKISLYAILRLVILANPSVGYGFSARLFTFFGICSLAVAAGFILVQKDLKRLLAYHSVEHMGVIAVGLGLGPAGGVFAALFHAFNHAVTKAFMFFCAGNAVQAYRTSDTREMRGMIQLLPWSGPAMFLGAFALGGLPPFSIFMSEFLILADGFSTGRYVVAALTMLFLTIAFAGLLHHVSEITLGARPRNMPRRRDTFGTPAALLFLGVFILGLGLGLPQGLVQLLAGCQQLILGQ